MTADGTVDHDGCTSTSRIAMGDSWLPVWKVLLNGTYTFCESRVLHVMCRVGKQSLVESPGCGEVSITCVCARYSILARKLKAESDALKGKW